MKRIIILPLIMMFAMNSFAQEETESTDGQSLEGQEVEQEEEVKGTVYSIELKANTTLQWDGDLADGQKIDDLSWAWNSSNACFPATQKEKFTGNHVFYVTEIPKYSEVTVKVIPDDEDANFSVYAYQTGTSNDAMVPDLPSCVRCEVDHKWDRQWAGKSQDHTRTVDNLVAINNPYRLVIAVVGAEGLTEGTYTLQVTLTSR